MDRQTAKAMLKQKEPDFLPLAKHPVSGHPSYVCPVCHNGTGQHGTGIAKDPHSKSNCYKCFKCGIHEDIIGLWKLHTHTEDDKTAFETLYAYYGMEVAGTYPTRPHACPPEKTDTIRLQQKQNEETEATAAEEDLTAYFTACQTRLSQTDYPARRGLCPEVLQTLGAGFDPHFRTTGGQVWQALILPTGKHSFVARNTDPCAGEKNRYRKHGASTLYHTEALWQAEKPVFVVEGELDAIAVMSAGGAAMALGSTANSNQLLQLLEKRPPQTCIILALDNDQAGVQASERLSKGFQQLGVMFHQQNPYNACKDAGEAILAIPDLFSENIRAAKALADKKQEAKLAAYKKTSAAYALQDFLHGITAHVDTPCFSTGFSSLDAVLDGGLYEGLSIVGAISSLGKTTLLLQIADQMAQKGTDVLIFSLEMAKTELIAKSISRLTFLQVIACHGDLRNAKTAREITTSSRYLQYSQEEKDAIQNAVAAYATYAGNLYFHEGIGDIGVAQIQKTVQTHIALTGKRPVVIIDYLQILAPSDLRATDKQNVDRAVSALKRISREEKIPIVAISTFNRSSYSTAVRMEAFKESGAIEYASDVLIGLQLKGTGEAGFHLEEAKRKHPREVELVILKNRNGKSGDVLPFAYYPMFHAFKESR